MKSLVKLTALSMMLALVQEIWAEGRRGPYGPQNEEQFNKRNVVRDRGARGHRPGVRQQPSRPGQRTRQQPPRPRPRPNESVRRHSPHGGVVRNRRELEHRSRRGYPGHQMRHRSYREYRHRPYREYRHHHNRWYTPRSYHVTIPSYHLHWDKWIRWDMGYSHPDGFYWHLSYPYFIHNGYRHRYSHVDICNYELVDSYTNTTYRSFPGYTCSMGYDLCANLRDDFNIYEGDYRYFCSERLYYRR